MSSPYTLSPQKGQNFESGGISLSQEVQAGPSARVLGSPALVVDPFKGGVRGSPLVPIQK